MAVSKGSARHPELEAALVALQPRLRRFAYGLAGSLDEADDLVQSAFERAFGRLGQWERGTRLDSWMFRIVQTIWFNRLNAQKVRRRHALAHAKESDLGYDGRARIESQLTLDRVRAFIWQLPEDQRAAILLVAVEGLSYQEASGVLGVPVGTVTSRLGRARMALRELMHEPESTPLKKAAAGESR